MAKFTKQADKGVADDGFQFSKATKHHTICNSDQSIICCVQPGDYIVLDRHFNLMVFSRRQFQQVFGHRILQLLDEQQEEQT